jgi:hypothetical protein
MSLRFPVIKAHHFEIQNIKEGHDIKASVGDTFVNYDEAFKKTKTALAKKLNKKYFTNSKCRQKEITRSHNIRLSIHFNGICPRAFQLVKPIISKCTILNWDMTSRPLSATRS